MVNQTSREETALNRYQVITPVLWAASEQADQAKLTQIKKEVMEKNSISRRTLMRWLTAYEKSGLDGLKPVERGRTVPMSIPERLIDEAIILRREVPGRSITQLIEILEAEGKAPPGLLKRTTLQQKLSDRGYSTRQIKLYQQDGVATRRYTRKERGDLWSSDIKHGSKIKIKGVDTQLYMVAIIDHCTRYIIHAEFYDNQEQGTVEDCLRKAILKEGAPKRIMFDNGKQFKNRWMRHACAMLDIKLIYTKIYSPESNGKSERFNKNVNSFLREIKLMNITSLEEYNRYFQVWLSESYQHRVHSEIKTTPEIAYKKSKGERRFLPPETITAAFLHREERRVDKSGCISFNNKKYEVGVTFIGQQVIIIYDPASTAKITVEHPPSNSSFEATELVIGEHTGPKPKKPEFMGAIKPETSRLLAAQARKSQLRHSKTVRAIKYSGFVEGGDSAD